VSTFTYRNIIILMETIKDLYKRLLDQPPRPLFRGWRTESKREHKLPQTIL
jgi:hypothetical protein